MTNYTWLMLRRSGGLPGDPITGVQLHDEGYAVSELSYAGAAAEARQESQHPLPEGDYVALCVEGPNMGADGRYEQLTISKRVEWAVDATPGDDLDGPRRLVPGPMPGDRPQLASPGGPVDVIVPEGDQGRVVPRDAVDWPQVDLKGTNIGGMAMDKWVVLGLNPDSNRWEVYEVWLTLDEAMQALGEEAVGFYEDVAVAAPEGVTSWAA